MYSSKFFLSMFDTFAFLEGDLLYPPCSGVDGD